MPNPANPQTLNRYAYVNNNPVKYRDPTGHIYADTDGNADNEDWAWYKNEHLRRRLYFSLLPVGPDQVGWIQWFGGTEFAYEEGADWNYDGYCQGFHCGVDLGASWGTEVRAGVSGTVVGVWGVGSDGTGHAGPYRVDIRVGRYLINYGHIDGDVLVNVGDRVSPNTVIAGVGNPDGVESENNNHIHLEIRLNNQVDQDGTPVNYVVNPVPLFRFRDYQALTVVAEDQNDRNVNFYSTDSWAGYPNPRSQPLIIRGGPSFWPAE